jgi:hypothetical protein
VDNRYKYAWFMDNGREQLFDLQNDPLECTDLSVSLDAEHLSTLASMRQTLAECLKDSPEGYVDNERLVPGRQQMTVLPTCVV